MTQEKSLITDSSTLFSRTVPPKFLADLTKGGQLGVGYQALHIDAATPLIYPPGFVICVQAPFMWKDKPEKGKFLKSMWESHVKAWSGVDFNYSAEGFETPVGRDSQQLSTPHTVKRSQPSPSATMTEIQGNGIIEFHREWLFDIQDPDTGVSLAGMDDDNLPPWVLSTISASFFFIQPDITMRPDRIIDAAFYTGIWPEGTGDYGFERQNGVSKGMERSITYKGLVMHNRKTKEIGIDLFKALNMHKTNLNMSETTFTSIQKEIMAAGLSKQISSMPVYE